MNELAAPSLADALARHAAAIASAELPPAVLAKARQHLLDGVASAFIGCRSAVFSDLAKSRGGSSELMGWAFAVNGSVSEDGSREGACHPAAAIVPVIMTYGAGKSLAVIERALVAGYDVMIRLARAGNPQLARQGFHGTAVTAPFGAAVTYALLRGLELPALRNALCLAALGGSGLMAAFKEGSTQPLQVGWGVRNGVQAARLAERGHLGYPRVLEEGFFRAYLESGLEQGVMEPLEKRYALESCYLKPYPGCRHMHASLEAFSTVMERFGFSHREIAAVRVGTYRIALETGIKTLNKRGDAYFNIPYALAARAVLGPAGYHSFSEEHFGNPDLKRVMELTRESVDPAVEAEYPGKRGSRVEVELADGRSYSHRVQYPLGEPEAPLSFSVTREKFLSESDGQLTACQQAALVNALEQGGGGAETTLECRLLTERLFRRSAAEGRIFLTR